jgi:hypothetical protein
MLVWLPVFFSLLLTIGLTVCIMVGAWFYRSNFFTASFITAGLLFIASGILGNEALVFFKDLQHYVTPNEIFAARILALSAAIPAIVAGVGCGVIAVAAVYKQWAFRQTIQEKYREVAGA